MTGFSVGVACGLLIGAFVTAVAPGWQGLLVAAIVPASAAVTGAVADRCRR